MGAGGEAMYVQPGGRYRSSFENFVQIICSGVGCKCRMLKAQLIFLCTTLGHVCVDIYIVQAF